VLWLLFACFHDAASYARRVYDDARIDTRLGGFTIEERIGHGATGTVYRAEREEPKGTFAIKVLSPDAANLATIKRRFEREAKVLRKLRHPSIVQIEDFGVEHDAAYIVMELLEGETLEARLQRAPLSAAHALSITRQILLALAHAHEREIAHRDLKPANVFLVGDRDAEPDVRLLDFGLAKFLSHDEADAEGTLTRKGRVVGTPAYMAPEQITGIAVDARVDVYSTGIVLYEMLADERPFQQTRRSELLRAHLFEEVPKLSEARPGATIDAKLEEALHKALAKDPARRFKNAQAFFEAIEEFDGDSVDRSGERAKPRSTAGTSSVLIKAEERTLASSTSKSDDQKATEKAEASEAPKSEDSPKKAGDTNAKKAGDTKAKKAGDAKSKEWKDAAWVSVLVWVVSLACFFSLVGTMVYSAVALRE
jgi:serine/threonine protein kinase